MKEPGPDHPITITPVSKPVRVTAGGTIVAETSRALALEEADYPAVLYVPRADAKGELLVRNPKTTRCPYKGEARYFDLTLDGSTIEAAVWSYEDPFPAVSAIKDHLAFYPERVDSIEEVG